MPGPRRGTRTGLGSGKRSRSGFHIPKPLGPRAGVLRSQGVGHAIICKAGSCEAPGSCTGAGASAPVPGEEPEAQRGKAAAGWTRGSNLGLGPLPAPPHLAPTASFLIRSQLVPWIFSGQGWHRERGAGLGVRSPGLCSSVFIRPSLANTPPVRRGLPPFSGPWTPHQESSFHSVISRGDEMGW